MKLNIYSFFSGAGFLDLGFEKENHTICFVNEYDKKFLDVYKYARQQIGYSEPIHGYFNDDINLLLKMPKTKMLLEYILQDKKNGLVGFIGGPPCPDFSIAGKNKGIDGEHGKLTETYKELILRCEPDFFLFENVKGLWTTKKHREIYEKIKQSFLQKGYVLIDKLVNSLEYGVPQERERVLLFGVKSSLLANNEKEATKILLDKFHWGNTLFNLENIKNILWSTTEEFIVNSEKEMPENIIKDLTIEYWFRKNDVYNHANANDYFKPKSIERFNTILEGDVSKKSFKRLHRWRYSPTAAYGNNEVHLHPYKPRRLSVAETLAIQSLPKEFIVLPEITLSSKFKTVGNGVPYLVAKSIAHQITMFLNENSIETRGE